jgi:subtilisin-like proprotein convertase family protein
MKFSFSILLSLLFLLTSVENLIGQVSVTGGLNALQLAEILAGSNITVSNAVISGPVQGYGSFSTSGPFPFGSGIVLTNGLLSQVPGPNNDPNTSSNLGGSGTAEMNALGGAASYDVVTLEFDFVVQSSSVQFQYIFASEEYPEFAPPNQPSFNDVFAFYISGPGITGQENIALIPGTTSPVSIDNVNAVTYSQYYVDNLDGLEIQFDGYTTDLTASRSGLTPCQTYHLRMVIADIQTANRNSAVFLKENSFVQENVLGAETQTINADGIALEGCVQGSFAFQFNEVDSQDRTITFSIGGTAVNGVDYSFIDNSITIPAGETSGTVYIDAFSDGLSEGPETITITYNSGVCVGTETVTLTINDAQPINFTLDGTNLDCFGDNSGEIMVNATGGFPGYSYLVTDPSGSSSTYTSNPITGLSAGEYSVQVQDTYGCKAEALVIGGQFNAGTTFLPDGSGATYQAPLTITGFNPGQTITSVDQIQQICLTMEHSYLGDLWIRVQSPSGQSVTLKEQNGGGSCDLGEPIATGAVDGGGSSDITPGVGYEYCFNAAPVFGTMVNESGNFQRNYTDGVGNNYQDFYLPEGSYTAFDNFSGLVGSQMNGTWTVFVTDQFGLDNGYIFNWYISLVGDLPDTTIVLTQPSELTVSGVASNATCGSSNGSVNISALNGVAPLSYSWSNGATTEDVMNVPSGQYSVTVTDANGCSTSESFFVNNTGTLFASGSVINASCFGGSNGSVDIGTSGGTAPYIFNWSNGSTTEDLSGLQAGEYTLSVTDAIGCQFSTSFTVGQAPQITATAVSVLNEQCNTDNGSIDINVTGGNGSYGYLWSNGATTQDLNNLTSGTYTVNISDGLGCSGSASFQVSNNLTGCSNFCYLNVTANSIVPSSCGTSTGAIDVNILNAQTPISISWSNTQTSEDLSNLLPGNYTVTVSDAANCSTTETFTVGNTTNGLTISSSSIVHETCGFDNGSINISVMGGIAPYQYSWSNGSISQNINGLSAGSYSVTVTDNSGCSASASFSILNNSGSLQVNGTVSSSLCSSNNGSIFQTVTGANGTPTFLWSNGATSQSVTGLAPGNYSCTITDASGCSVTNNYSVGQNSGNVAVNGILVTNEVCNNNQGAINITVSGNGLTYLWSNGATTEDITGLSAGNYSCTVSNAQGCTVNTGVISLINSPGSMVVSNQSVTSATCGSANGAVDINVFNGQAPYTYLWSNGSATQDIAGLNAGVYTLQISDNNGCSLAHSVTVGSSSGSLIVDLVGITHESCVSGSGTNGQGAIDINVSGSTAPFSYLWSNGATTQDISGLTDGVYSVTVTSSAGCSLTQSYTVLANGSNLSVQSVAITNETCGSGTGAINISMDQSSGPYSFSWSNGASTEDISGLDAGNYQLIVSNSFGCQIIQNFTVNNSSGSLSITGLNVTNENCGNGTGAVDLSVFGGNAPLTYQWSNGLSTQDISSLNAGTYSVLVSDIFGCTVQSSATINNISNGLSVQIDSVTDEICGQSNGAVDISANAAGTITYLWSNGSTTEDLNGVTAGNYTVVVTDQTGCQVFASTSVQNQTGSLSISFVNVQNEICGNAQGFIDIQVSGTGPVNYLWSNGSNTQDITGLNSGSYIVSVTDGTGCILNQTFTVSNTNESQVSASLNVTDAFCNSPNGAIDLQINAGITPFSYSWSNESNTQDISNLTPGNYTVVITDGFNCQSIASAYVGVQNSDLQITNIEVYNDFCNDQQGGFIVNASGSVQNYYLNGIPQGSEFIFGLGEGTYLIEVIDIFGCTVSSTGVIENDAFFDLSETHMNTTCGNSAGSINLILQGGGGGPGGGDFTYLWSNGATTQDLNNIPEGTYTVTVTNGGCSDQLTIQITNDNGFEVSAVVGSDNCGEGSGSINQIVTNGNGTGMTYLWSNGSTTEDLTNLVYGNYVCTVTEAGGCSIDYNYSVGNLTNGTQLSVDAENEVCGDASGSIDVSLTGGSGNFTILWSNGETSEDLSALNSGNYAVTITDLNDGCILGTIVQIIDELTIFQGSGIVTNSTCATCTEGSVNVIASNSSTYTYLWSNGSTTQDISGLIPGTYSVVIASAEGCDTTMVFEVLNTASLDEVSSLTPYINVFPNPARGAFYLNLILHSDLETEVMLTDAVGKEIESRKINSSGTFQFRTESLSQGVYFVILRYGNDQLVKRLIIEIND